MDKELGEDIISMYKAYENKATVWKKTKLNNQTFELPDYYEVVSLSTNQLMKSEWGLTEQLRPPSTTGCSPRRARNQPWSPSRK